MKDSTKMCLLWIMTMKEFLDMGHSWMVFIVGIALKTASLVSECQTDVTME